MMKSVYFLHALEASPQLMDSHAKLRERLIGNRVLVIDQGIGSDSVEQLPEHTRGLIDSSFAVVSELSEIDDTIEPQLLYAQTRRLPILGIYNRFAAHGRPPANPSKLHLTRLQDCHTIHMAEGLIDIFVREYINYDLPRLQ